MQGYVAKVEKKVSARGGSARPEFVKQRHGCCFQLLSFLHLPGGYSEKKFVDWTSTTTTASSTRTAVSSSSLSSAPLPQTRRGNPKTLIPQYSSLITYGTKKESYYALKSNILDRCSSAEFQEELKSERVRMVQQLSQPILPLASVEILKSLDHPHIVHAMETFYHHNRVFILLELCSGGDLHFAFLSLVHSRHKKLQTSLGEPYLMTLRKTKTLLQKQVSRRQVKE